MLYGIPKETIIKFLELIRDVMHDDCFYMMIDGILDDLADNPSISEEELRDEYSFDSENLNKLIEILHTLAPNTNS